MVRRCVAVVLIGWVMSAGLRAQEPVALQGRVVSGESRGPVAAATVASGDRQAVTGDDGRFVLLLVPGQRLVTVTAEGFLDQTLALEITATPVPVEILLTVRPPVREDITVSAEREAADATPATVAIAPTAVLRVAGSADNIFKALQTLPGVTATDDFGSRLSVRGGGPDQNLTVMDGVEIHNPYRLFGLTSAFNPETVERFELTAGGFGVEYGDRLSSILVVENRSGTSSERLAGSAALSLTDTNIVLEGRLPGAATGSWLVTGRRTYYDLIADRITGNDLPSFGDVQAKVEWAPAPGHSLRLFGLRSRERTDATFTDSGDRIAIGDDSRNDLLALNYRAVFGASVLSRTTVAWYDYGDDLAVDGSVRDGARRSNTPGPAGESRSNVVFTRALGVRDVSVRQQVDVQLGRRHALGTGFDAHALRTTWGWTITGDRNASAANGSAVIGGAGLPANLRSTQDTTRVSAWVVDRMTLGRGVRLEPGLRIDWSGLNDEQVLSPRLAAVVDVTPRTRVRAAVGRFTQSPGYEKLLQSDYFVDLSEGVARGLSSERSIHTIAALEHELTPAVTVRAEGYSKRFSRLLLGRLETAQETAARVARYDFPAAYQWSVPRDSQITSVPFNGGEGHAYGFDTYIEKRAVRPGDRLSGWASYTWGRANLEAYGVRRPFDYDRRHALSVVSTLGLGARLDLGTTLRVASGFPATTPVGVRIAATDAADGSGRLVPSLDETGQPVWVVDFGGVSNLARGRLPVYARLDMRVTFKPRNPASRWQVYVDVLNVLDRKNVSQLEPDLDPDPTSDRPAIRYTSDSGLPRLPSFGFRYRF